MKISGIRIFAIALIVAGGGYFVMQGGEFRLIELIAGQCVGAGVVWFAGDPPRGRRSIEDQRGENE